MIKRDIEKRITDVFFRGRAVIIYGARRVGKTTLLRMIQDNLQKKSLFLNCDEPEEQKGTLAN